MWCMILVYLLVGYVIVCCIVLCVVMGVICGSKNNMVLGFEVMDVVYGGRMCNCVVDGGLLCSDVGCGVCW